MAVGLPAKTTYANGDVFSASDINDTNGTINLIGQTTNFYAGKNKIINGDFEVWQRGTSFTANGPTADRWRAEADTTFTASRQTFTPGTAPVAGYEGEFFYRMAKNAGGTYGSISQRIEDVRVFAGQTITVSFWAKADSATTIVRAGAQNFGSGGSSQVNFALQSQAITTSWARYSLSFAVPSIAGKTIGTSSHFILDLYFLETGAKTVDLWGVQVEAGSTATAFQTATGTIQGELAACQRYYYRARVLGAFNHIQSQAIGNGSTTSYVQMTLPTVLRTNPTSVEWGGDLRLSDGTNYLTITSITTAGGLNNMVLNNVTTSTSVVQYRPYYFQDGGAGTSFVGLSAEL
jgi:hypothetical protein